MVLLVCFQEGQWQLGLGTLRPGPAATAARAAARAAAGAAVRAAARAAGAAAGVGTLFPDGIRGCPRMGTICLGVLLGRLGLSSCLYALSLFPDEKLSLRLPPHGAAAKNLHPDTHAL